MSGALRMNRVLPLSVGILYLLTVTYALADSAADRWVVADFDRIYVQGNAIIELRPEQGTYVHGQGDAKALAGLGVEVMDSVLYIDARHVAIPAALNLIIGVQQLQEIVLDGQGVIAADRLQSKALVLEGLGAGAFDVQNLKVQELVIVGTGQTVFSLSGQVSHQSIDIAGSGAYRGDRLQSQISQVSVRGNGDVNLWADHLLDVNVYGSANVRYSGGARVHRRIFGHGAVSRVPRLGTTSL